MLKSVTRAIPSVSRKNFKLSNRIIIVAMAVFGLIALLGLLYFCRSEKPRLTITRQLVFSDHNALLEKVHTDPKGVLKSDNYDAYPLHKAILANDAKQLEDLCKSSDCKKWLMQKDQYGVTPLFYLIVHPKREDMQATFLKHATKAFVDWEAYKAQKLPDGKSPFHVISDYDIGALPDLADYNVKFTKVAWENVFKDWPYQYPLHYAVKQDDARAIIWLIQAKYPLLQEHNSRTALQYAIAEGKDTAAFFIADSGGAEESDLKLTEGKGMTLVASLLRQQSN